jgi:YebC/PmpR family DNA-binding regulatory protein
MSGHNKWSTIKHKKGAADAKRGKLFTKLARALTSSARQGGGDPDMNAALRAAVDKARAANMPKDNIEAAIKRGTGDLEGVTYETLTYEGYGPGGVAIMLDVMTDNRNRTVAEIRSVFTRANGALGTDGSVAWMFETLGQIVIPVDQVKNEDDLMLAALDAGADDVRRDDEQYVVTCAPSAFPGLQSALAKAGWSEPESAEVTRIAKNTVRVAGKDAEVVMRLLENLEDNDDVQQVYANCDIDDEAAKAYAS